MSHKVQKSCKTCKKLYTPCTDCERDKTAFHWRTVACSYECGMKYFEKVMNARSKNKIEKEEFHLTKTSEEESILQEKLTIDIPKKKNKKASVKVAEEVKTEQETLE